MYVFNVIPHAVHYLYLRDMQILFCSVMFKYHVFNIVCLEKSLKYWLNVKRSSITSLNDVYNDSCVHLLNLKTSWVYKITQQLSDLGLCFVWTHFDRDCNYFPIIKNRMRDLFIQKWFSDIKSSSKLNYCKDFKTTFEFESYLENIKNDRLRICFTKIRISDHKLAVEIGRYIHIVRNERYCELCNTFALESLDMSHIKRYKNKVF